MRTPRQQRSSSKATRRGRRSRRGRSPSPRPGCINAAASAAVDASSSAVGSAASVPQQPSRSESSNHSNCNCNCNCNCCANDGEGEMRRRRTSTPPTTTGRTSPMTTSARRIGAVGNSGGIGCAGVGNHMAGAGVLGGRAGAPGSFVPPHLRSTGATTGADGSAGGRRGGLVRRTHSPKTVASPLSKPVQLSELSRCPVPPMSSSTRQQQHARPRPILPERTGSSSKQGHKRKAADGHDDGIHANKRQNLFLPVVKASSSSSSAGNKKGEGSKNSNNKRRPSSSSSRSRSPKSPRSSSPAIPTARVLTIAPTVRGISEAARILRNSASSAATATTTNKRSNSQSPTTQGETDSKSSPRSLTNTPAQPSGILSFPTETVYTLSTCVRLRPNHYLHHLLHHSVKSSLGTCTSRRERNGRSESSSSASSISSSSSSSSDGEACSWLGREKGHASLNTLLGLKGKQCVNGDVQTAQTLASVGSNCDLPLLYVHSPSQHRHHFQFTRPKTFMIKKSKAAESVSGGDGPSDGSGIQATSPGSGGTSSMVQMPDAPSTPEQHRQRQSDSGALVPTVTLSESREVLDRITAAFWPGPVAIFAPAKLRRVAELGCPEGKGYESLSDFAPVLPYSILFEAESRMRDAAGSDAGKQMRKFVGIRCPSHPLARRCLEEVYYKNAGSDLSARPRASPGSARGHRHCTKSCVVVGFDASIPTADHDSATKTPPSKYIASATPTKAKEVCVQLLSPSTSRKKTACGSPPKESSLTKDTIPVVHVLNGEDRRELFSHVTCEFGPDAFVALIVDDESRTVRIIKRLDQNGTDHHPTICSANVTRALLRTPPQITPLSPVKGVKRDPDVAASAGARVITAVLQRWKVSEEIVG